jgi:type VI protein secretion system component Hcp
MALEQFIEITGVVGEASAPDVHSAIPVLSWTFGLAQAEGSRSPGGVSFSGFRFSKRVDSSTPLLMDLCARRSSASQARLVVRSTGHKDPRVVVDLREVVVAEICASFDPTVTDLVENVALRFERVWFGGAVVDRKGSSEQVNWFAWDLGRDRPASAE